MAEKIGQGISLNAYDALVKVLMKWATATGNEGSQFLDLDHRAGEGGRTEDLHDPILDAEHLLTFLLPQNEILDFRIPRDNDNHFHPELATAISPLNSSKEAGAIPENMFRRLLVLMLQYFLRHSDDKDRQFFGGAAYFRNSDQQTGAAKADEQTTRTHHVDLTRDVCLTESYSFSITLCIAAMTLVARFMDERGEKTEAIKGKGKPLPEWVKEKLKKLRAARMVTDSDPWNAEFASLKWRELLVLVAYLAGQRLSEAMTGLVASFSVSYEVDIDPYRTITRREWTRHKARLQKLTARFEALGYDKWRPENHAVECGWSWGPLHPRDLPEQGRVTGERTYDFILEEARKLSSGMEVHAENAPYFYFTVSALDSIADLSSEAVKNWELLDARQNDLANRLTNLADLTRAYWSELAFGEEGDDRDWPVADFPWSPSDTDPANPEAASSEYWNLYLLRISAASRLKSARAVDASRVVENLTRLLSALADSARITRAPFPPRRDPAVQNLHLGFSINMNGSYRPKRKGAEDDLETGEVIPVKLERKIYDFAPQLLKVCAEVMDSATDPAQRDALGQLANGIWAHLVSRSDENRQAKDIDKTKEQGTLSWDNARGAFPEHEGISAGTSGESSGTGGPVSRAVTSWSFTERVVEALVVINRAQEKRPAANLQLRSMVLALLSQLEFEVKRKANSLQGLKTEEQVTMRSTLARHRIELDAARREVDESASFSLVKAMKVADELASLTKG